MLGLPVELVLHFLSYLDQVADLHSASLVCRSWMYPSRLVEWGQVRRLHIEGPQIAALSRVLDSGTSIPHRIGWLSIGDADGYKQHLNHILAHFTEVANLELCDLAPCDLGNSIMTREKWVTHHMGFRKATFPHLQDAKALIERNPSIQSLTLDGVDAFVHQPFSQDDCIQPPNLAQLVDCGRCNLWLRTVVGAPSTVFVVRLLGPQAGNPAPRALSYSLFQETVDRNADTLRFLAIAESGGKLNDPARDQRYKIDLPMTPRLESLSIDATVTGALRILRPATYAANFPSLRSIYIAVGSDTGERRPLAPRFYERPEWETLDRHFESLSLGGGGAPPVHIEFLVHDEWLASNMRKYLDKRGRLGHEAAVARLPLCTARGIVRAVKVGTTATWDYGPFGRKLPDAPAHVQDWITIFQSQEVGSRLAMEQPTTVEAGE